MTAVTLLGLPPQLAADARILIVDTELAATAAASLLPAYTVLRPSTDMQLQHLSMDDLLPLNGLDVLLWPTNAEVCREAMGHLGSRLAKLTDRVRMIYVNGTDPVAFSLAAMGEWTQKEVVAWAKQRARTFEVPIPPNPEDEIDEAIRRRVTPSGEGSAGGAGDAQARPAATDAAQAISAASDTEHSGHLVDDAEDVNVSRLNTGYTQDTPKRVRRGKPRTKPNGEPPAGTQLEGGESAFVSWEAMGLDRNGNGAPHAHLANVQRVLATHPQMTGRLWYDEFHDKVFQTLFQEGTAEWADHHDTRLTIWMQRELRLAKIGVQSVRLAVDEFARHVTRNEPQDWLKSLTWDKTERLPTLMADGWGAPQNDYTSAVGRCWMVSMAARILSPGCQADYMPVFEGDQGLRKSSALRVIGGKWFAEAHESVLSKDFFQNLQGRMLLEVTEMDTFSRAEVNRVKQVITCPTDRYRASYGRRAEDHPRRSVFAGTTNRDDWVRDDTGARRFWPIVCGDINLEYLRQVREQLFAEAVHRFKAGEPWWDIDPVLAKAEQDDRREPDPWAEAVLQWCAGKDRVRVPDVLSLCLQLPLHMHGKAEQMRIASILRVAGWKRRTVRDRLVILKAWINPAVTAVTATLDL